MNARLLLAALVLLSIPGASGAPAGATVAKETVTIGQQGSSLSVEERIEFQVSDAAGWASGANWTLWLQPDATGVQASASRNGQEQVLAPPRVGRIASAGPFHQFYANLSGLYGNVSSGEALVLTLRYTAGSTYSHRLSSVAETLVVFAEPDSGFEPTSTNLPAFFPTGDRYHAAMQGAPEGLTFTVGFVAAGGGPAGARDLNPYLWGAAGLVGGFLVAAFLARRGKLGAAPKKFEKGGEMESRDVLEARRRSLMAALKELELAHEAKEIPDSAYAPLKEEYKAQAVRVMRSLEEKREGAS